MKAMKWTIKLLRGLIIAVLSLVIAMNLWLLIDQAVLKHDPPQIFGYSQLIVTTGSMEPSIRPGDVVIIREMDSYQMGDVVTFRDPEGSLVTHRIVGQNSEGFITKGDANNVEDDRLLKREQVVGGLVACLPMIGGLMLFLKSPLGILVLVVTGFLLIELPVWLAGRDEKTEGKHAK